MSLEARARKKLLTKLRLSSLHLKQQRREIALPIGPRLIGGAQLGSAQQPLAGASQLENGTPCSIGLFESAIGSTLTHDAEREVD
jgi:hypothetical protein